MTDRLPNQASASASRAEATAPCSSTSAWRLNEWGYLAKLARISSVSGGSITAGVLGFKWAKLAFDAGGGARGFDAEVVQTIRALAERTIDEGSILGGVFLPGSISDKVADAYRKYLFGTCRPIHLAL